MERMIPIGTAPKAATVARFIGIGLVIYALLLAGSEWLLHRNGRMNPIYKADAAAMDVDWLVLGASRAMPLDFGGFNAEMERDTGLTILNLAGPGTGPLYNRFVLEHFLSRRRARNVLYVADGFAFRAPVWNEGRFSDGDLLARTPFHPALAARLAGYVAREGVDPRALADYVTGFSKLNNRNRFRRDVWEGEASFERTFRLSPSAERSRIGYLYPPVADETAMRERYLAAFAGLVETAQRSGAGVTVVRMPLPPRFRSLLPGEAGFGAALGALADRHKVAVLDYSGAMPDPGFYADTDHLNDTGVAAFFTRHLRAVLVRQP
ncbi:MAG: hypothetical protein DCC69_09460 [Hyphomicrobiales bacterium]|nr:MAG: hypothetical protein DCC69_09460 [Hyphomicrobiales bacterium]